MDLMDIYEAASTLPPSTVTDPLAVILDGLNGKGRPEGDSGRIKAMVSGGCLADGGLLDLVESAGCLITEDDFCNGIRQFDMSHNASSEYLYYEILDAFSYSPLCPSLRPPEDRFELLFAMLKNYGIQMVIFLKDTMCSPAADELEYIRVRLMRSGVDPVITDTGSAVETLRSYLDAIR
jgi:benzoyl-CoA reductase/2-hydroxyglutaryl-CoA dehydratase subunit BcrC/BadD/HgdB